MNRIVIKWVVISVLILALAVLFTRLGAHTTRISDVPTFRMTLSNEPPTLDWNLATDSVSFTVLINLMEGLTEYDEALRPRPAAARSWEVSHDGRVYRFH